MLEDTDKVQQVLDNCEILIVDEELKGRYLQLKQKVEAKKVCSCILFVIVLPNNHCIP